MGQLFKIVLSLSISGTLLGGILLLIRPFTRKFFSGRWIYYLWLLLLCRLLLPVQVGVNVMDGLFTAASDLMIAGEAEGVRDDLTDRSGQPGEAVWSAPMEDKVEEAGASTDGDTMAGDRLRVEEENDPRTERRPALHEDSYMRLHMVTETAGIIWLVGVAFAVLWKLMGYGSFIKDIRHSSALVTDPVLLAQRDACLEKLKMGRRVPVYMSRKAGCPMLVGFFSSCIILPADMLAEWGKEQSKIDREGMMLVLHHELMHCKRRDIGYKWLYQLVLCVHWFNPFLYFFRRKFYLDCELACDEAVMGALTDEGRKAYGAVLLHMAEKNLTDRRNVLAMTLLEEKSSLKERLSGIIGYHRRGAAAILCSAAVTAVLCIIALAGGVASDRQGTGEGSPLEAEEKYLMAENAVSVLDGQSRTTWEKIFSEMEPEDASEVFKGLLNQDVTLYADDWKVLFTYSDQHKSAEYLAEALQEGKAQSFYGNGIKSVMVHVNTDDWVEIVTSMQKLSYNMLQWDGVLSFLNRSQSETCIMHCLDLGNTLTDSQLEGLKDYVSTNGLKRIKARNEEIKDLR